MAVISKLDYNGQDITRYNSATIRNINFNGVDYHFAKPNEVASNVCENAVNEPIIDMQVSGNTIQDGTPTLEAPIEIQSVGEKTINLFKMPASSSTNVTVLENGLETLYAGRCAILIDIPQLEVGKKYTCKVDVENVTTGSSGTVRLADGTNSTVIFTYTTGATIFTVTEAFKNYNQLWIYGVNTKYLNIMIVEGEYTSETFPEYEPYGYKIPIIKRGLNWANISNGFITQYTGISNEVFGSKLKTTCSVSARGGNLSVGNFPAGIYTVSLKRFSSFKDNVETPQFLTTFVNDKNINVKIGANEKVKFTLTATSSITFYHAFSNSNDYYILEDLMLYAGEEEKQFEPYIEPTTTNIYVKEPLRMINDIADVLDYKNKKVIRNVGRVVYDGSDTSWSLYTSGEGYRISETLLVDGKPVLCNMFVNSQSLVKTHAIRKNFQSLYCFGLTTQFPADTDWETYLSENNMEVIGQLATPTEETIEVPEIMTLDGTTNIEIATEVSPTSILVTYWKQI